MAEITLVMAFVPLLMSIVIAKGERDSLSQTRKGLKRMETNGKW